MVSLRALPPVTWVIRHWRGDLSLPLSFWVNGTVIAMMGIGFILVTALQMQIPDAPPVTRVTAVVITVVHVLALWLWMSVGVWRSAGRHANGGGRRAWGLAARTVVVLGAAMTALMLVGVSSLLDQPARAVAAPAPAANEPVYTRPVVERMLKESDAPLYKAIAENLPEVYEDLVTQITAGMAEGGSQAEMAARITPVVEAAITPHLYRGSDEAILAFAEVVIETLETIHRADPAACRAYLNSEPVDVGPIVGEELRRRDVATTLMVVRSLGDYWILSSEELSETLDQIAADVAKTRPSDGEVFQAMFADTLSPEHQCVAVILLYREGLNLPAPLNAAFLRSLLKG